jgi:hypothetical protein
MAPLLLELFFSTNVLSSVEFFSDFHSTFLSCMLIKHSRKELEGLFETVRADGIAVWADGGF